MSDGVKDATLRLADSDKWLDRELKKQIGGVYQDLSGATIQVFWIFSKPLTLWGNIKVATEELWLLAKVDLVIQLNEDLWDELDEDGRRGLLAHFLWQAEKKTGGTTIQRHEGHGERQLYSLRTATMKVAPEVLARHPDLLTQLEELRDFKSAVDNPRQFLLDLAGPGEPPPAKTSAPGRRRTVGGGDIGQSAAAAA